LDLCGRRASEMMQYGAKLRPVGINIYISGIAVVGWRSSCGEIKHEKEKKKEEREDDKLEERKRKTRVKNTIVFVTEDFYL